jgi:hypothetical protein
MECERCGGFTVQELLYSEERAGALVITRCYNCGHRFGDPRHLTITTRISGGGAANARKSEKVTCRKGRLWLFPLAFAGRRTRRAGRWL